MNADQNGLRGRVTKQGEEAIGKLAQDLLKSPLLQRHADGGLRRA